MTTIRRIAVAAVALASLLTGSLAVALADSGQPRLTMHRAGVGDVDASGWYRAVSTAGSFEALLPLPFNDFTVAADDPNIGTVDTHVIGAKSSDGFKITISETPLTPRMKKVDLASLLASLQADPRNAVSEVERANQSDLDSLTFKMTSGVGSGYLRYVLTAASMYTLVIEYPTALDADARPIRDKLFASFKLKAKP